MLRAMYDFQAPYEGTLTFGENELFVVLKKHNKDNNWVHVINADGVNGYAPANYLTAADCGVVEEMEHIDRILNRITAKKKGVGDQKNVMENLLELRNKLEVELERMAAKQVYELTSIIRQTTKCSFHDAHAATLASLEFLKRNVLPVPNGLERISKVNLSQIPLEVRFKGQDSRQLEELVEVVMETASDQETCVDLEIWNNLLDVLTHADPVLCSTVLLRNDCAVIQRLIQRLQGETSWRKRQPILAILFHGLQLSPVFLDVALNSVMPAELARDIQTIYSTHGCLKKDRLDWSVRLLTLSLCSKDCISFTQQSELGREFVLLLLDILEGESVSIATAEQRLDDGPDLATSVLHLILALHVQFQRVCNEDNAVLAALSEAENSKCAALIEKVILLYNREDDPLEKFRRDDLHTDSVTCFVFGLCSSVHTARLFYTAELEVVHDVILRQLTDYGPGDQRRTEALRLLNAIGRTCYVPYRRCEFAKCLKDICDESRRLGCSNAEMETDRNLVLKMYHEFPHLRFTES